MSNTIGHNLLSSQVDKDVITVRHVDITTTTRLAYCLSPAFCFVRFCFSLIGVRMTVNAVSYSHLSLLLIPLYPALVEEKFQMSNQIGIGTKSYCCTERTREPVRGAAWWGTMQANEKKADARTRCCAAAGISVQCSRHSTPIR